MKDNLFSRSLQHELEQPRSILCFYAAWPLTLVVAVTALIDAMAGAWLLVCVELLAASVLALVPLFFKKEHQFRWVRRLLALVLLIGYIAILTTRADQLAGVMWLPMFPIFAYIALGARTAHPLVLVMWLLFLGFSPFSGLGLHDGVMLAAAMLTATLVANKYESALALYHARLSHLAEKDPVTEIANRRALLAYLDSFAFDPAPLSLLMLDIDHFKAINDTLGHSAGDRALRRVAKMIEGQLRDGQRIGRWGGDEFLVVLPAVDFQLAGEIAQRLHTNVRHFEVPNLSIGVATRGADESTSELIHRADLALIRAKSEGRNRLVLAEA